MPAPAPRSTRDSRDGPTPAPDLVRLIVEAAHSKKAVDVTVLDLRGLSSEVDFFVICTATTDTQIKAVTEGIVRDVRDAVGERPVSREGQPGASRWIVLDYFDVAVHVFDPELRAHYDLERLWGDAPMETVADDAETIALLDA